MKIYTRTGDTGETALLGGTRVPKDAHRVATYGDVDELNALLGVAAAAVSDAALREVLVSLQTTLFAIGSRLADPSGEVVARLPKAALGAADVATLERTIDDYEARLPPLTSFILPGGSPGGAQLHLARTVCRRAERAVVALAREERIDPLVVTWLNRLSDLLFVLARAANHASGRPEQPW